MENAFEVSVFGDEPLPLVLSPRGRPSGSEFLDLLREHGPEIRRRLLVHGGVLFRGFSVSSAEGFEGIVAALAQGPALDYIGGDSPRTKLTRSVYTSTEAPSAVKIPLHNELSFTTNHPKHIFFHCAIAPGVGGETILGDARRVYEKLDSAVRQRFLERRFRYVSRYHDQSKLMDLVNPSHKSWRQVFETDDPARVEELCRQHDFTCEWLQSGWVRISQTRPAAMTHPETGEDVWFSQPHLYDFNPRLLGAWRWVGAKLFYARPHTRLHEIFHADGTAVAREDLYHLMDTLDACTVSFPWQQGDVLMLDNVLSMHGRATFEGPRRILAALTS
jgi:alpha-ketoglutarate-dependent taurine dioxygenase